MEDHLGIHDQDENHTEKQNETKNVITPPKTKTENADQIQGFIRSLASQIDVQQLE